MFFYTESCDMISHVLLSDSLFFLAINLLSIKFTDILNADILLRSSPCLSPGGKMEVIISVQMYIHDTDRLM